MFDRDYYLGKKKKLEEKIQKLQNDTFTTYLQVSSNFFNTSEEIRLEMKEVEEQLNGNAAKDFPMLKEDK